MVDENHYGSWAENSIIADKVSDIFDLIEMNIDSVGHFLELNEDIVRTHLDKKYPDQIINLIVWQIIIKYRNLPKKNYSKKITLKEIIFGF